MLRKPNLVINFLPGTLLLALISLSHFAVAKFAMTRYKNVNLVNMISKKINILMNAVKVVNVVQKRHLSSVLAYDYRSLGGEITQ